MKKLLIIQGVWRKGRLVYYYNSFFQSYFLLDPSLWRMDSFGNLIYYGAYGNRKSIYGWEIDHINPNGPDELWNLQPLQWYANVIKSNYKISAMIKALFKRG